MIKCTNCNQFVEESDKFCKYCGCPTPMAVAEEKEVKVKAKTEKQIIDEIQLEKTIVTSETIDGASEIDYATLSYKIIGDKRSINTRSIILFVLAMVVGATCLGLCFLFKSMTSQVYSVILFMISIILMFFCAASAAERFNNITMLSKLEERRIHIPRYGLKKTPIFLLGGTVFKLHVNGACPDCDGEILGDLHIERIENRPVAVCNYNRKHVFYIAEQAYFDRIVGINSDMGSDIDTSTEEAKVEADGSSVEPTDNQGQ